MFHSPHPSQKKNRTTLYQDFYYKKKRQPKFFFLFILLFNLRTRAVPFFRRLWWPQGDCVLRKPISFSFINEQTASPPTWKKHFGNSLPTPRLKKKKKVDFFFFGEELNLITRWRMRSDPFQRRRGKTAVWNSSWNRPVRFVRLRETHQSSLVCVGTVT